MNGRIEPKTDDYSGPADYLSMSLECSENQLNRDSRSYLFYLIALNLQGVSIAKFERI